MSLEDLKRLGVYSDPAENTHARPHVSVPWFVLTTLIAIVGCALIAFGDGTILTWGGLALFTTGLIGFIRVNMRGVSSE